MRENRFQLKHSMAYLFFLRVSIMRSESFKKVLIITENLPIKRNFLLLQTFKMPFKQKRESKLAIWMQ